MKGARLLLCAAMAACESELPEPAPGGRIIGTVRYDGDAHRSLLRPGLQVLAYPVFPPTAPPHGIVVLEPSDFTDVPYELRNLAPFDAYKVFARVAELEDPLGGPEDLPLGGWPSFCALARAGGVSVTAEAPTTGIDIVLYDDGGLSDPCNIPSGDLCPEPGQATLDLTIVSSRVPAAADTLLVALFDEFPSMTPAVGYLFPGAELSFPHRVIDNAIPPAIYPAVYACLDVGSNNLSSLCGSEDAFVLSTDPPINFPPDQVIALTADLDAAELSVDGVFPPSMFGCP